MKQPYRLPPELSPDPPRREDDLGDLVSEHRARTPVGQLAAIVLLILMAPAAVNAVCGAAVPRVLWVGAAAAVGLFALARLGATWKPRVEIWDKGLVVKRRWTHPRTIRFEDVDSVFYEPPWFRLLSFRPSIGIRITTHTGGHLAIPADLSATDKIVSSLERRVGRGLLAPAKRAFADGEELHFGPLVLHARVVSVAGEVKLPLEDLDCVEARPHELRLYRRGQNWPPFASVPLHAIPHPRVLLAVLATRVPVEDGTGLPT